MKKRGKKKTVEWRIGRSGVRFTVKKGSTTIRGNDGKPRAFRTRDAAARVARELNSR